MEKPGAMRKLSVYYVSMGCKIVVQCGTHVGLQQGDGAEWWECEQEPRMPLPLPRGGMIRAGL
jgi:hypothetical protein